MFVSRHQKSHWCYHYHYDGYFPEVERWIREWRPRSLQLIEVGGEKRAGACDVSATAAAPVGKITMAIFSSFYWSIVHDFHDCTTLGNRSSVQIRISNAQSESRPSGGGSTSSPGRFVNIIDTIRNIYECFWMRSWCSSLFYSLVFFFFSSRIIVSKFDI